MPKVSIVLPTFNGSRYIRTTIESCLSQTYRDFELIIVNDCSTDDTSKILREYAGMDNRIKVFTNKKNEKLPQTLNIGFEVAKGDYFTWISDDNIYSPTAIETLLKNITENPTVSIVYSSYYFIDERGNKLDVYGYKPEELVFSCAPGACFLYKRVVHEQLGGYDSLKCGMEDMDFWLRAAAKFIFLYINNKDLFYYRKHLNSMSAAINSDPRLYERYRGDHFRSFKEFFSNALKESLSDKEIDLHLELYFNDAARNNSADFQLAVKLNDYLAYCNKLKGMNWQRIGFDTAIIEKIVEKKCGETISYTVNNLVFQNKTLQRQNPTLAAHFYKPISWYYKEYEVLPSWYKKVGHIIKFFQRNRPLRSFSKNEKDQ